MKDNYALQAQQARRRFLTYDQQMLIEKYDLRADEDFLYTRMLSDNYRISRSTGDLFRQHDGAWENANSYEEVMTLLDLLCDARPDRHLAHQWKSMQAFGLLFHSGLLEGRRDKNADFFDENPQVFEKGCQALGGEKLPQGDMAYAVELFDGLCIGVQFWFSDADFPASLHYMWDANALQYIRYETMYFAVALLLRRIRQLGQ